MTQCGVENPDMSPLVYVQMIPGNEPNPLNGEKNLSAQCAGEVVYPHAKG